jgi:hypothetical protein
MTIHFISSNRGQAGKSWLIRAMTEIFARTDDRMIVVDASSDKHIGLTYSPTFNLAYDIRFSSLDCCAADRLLDFGMENTLIVKVPASDHQAFLQWVRDTELISLNFPVYYWSVSTGKDQYPPEILDLFGQNCFLVNNYHYHLNFRDLSQPRFDAERQMTLRSICVQPSEVYQIEISRIPLSRLTEEIDTQILTRSRIYRFLTESEKELELIISQIAGNFARGQMCHF